jgi:peptide/nickel transport system substrate-binding protein
VAQDIPQFKAWGEVTFDLLGRLGMTLDRATVDWGTVVSRRTQKSAPAQGGWNMFHTFHNGASTVNPGYIGIRANGDNAWFGWPNIPEVETEIAAWYEATTLDEEKAAMRRLNKAALDHVVYAPVGFFLLYQAWRSNLSGVAPGPLPFFWGVSKTA